MPSTTNRDAEPATDERAAHMDQPADVYADPCSQPYADQHGTAYIFANKHRDTYIGPHDCYACAQCKCDCDGHCGTDCHSD